MFDIDGVNGDFGPVIEGNRRKRRKVAADTTGGSDEGRETRSANGSDNVNGETEEEDVHGVLVSDGSDERSEGSSSLDDDLDEDSDNSTGSSFASDGKLAIPDKS